LIPVVHGANDLTLFGIFRDRSDDIDDSTLETGELTRKFPLLSGLPMRTWMERRSFESSTAEHTFSPSITRVWAVWAVCGWGTSSLLRTTKFPMTTGSGFSNT
jgi:hypothetical protein